MQKVNKTIVYKGNIDIGKCNEHREYRDIIEKINNSKIGATFY